MSVYLLSAQFSEASALYENSKLMKAGILLTSVEVWVLMVFNF